MRCCDPLSVQEAVQGWMPKGCELHRRSSHASVISTAKSTAMAKAKLVQQAPKAGALPD